MSKKGHLDVLNDTERKKDLFGQDVSMLKNKKLFLFDMDGTIYEEEQLFKGTLELMSEIHKKGGQYIFITNNSSKSMQDYIKKLSNMKIKVDENNFSTSTQATIEFLHKNYKNKTVYCMGTNSLIAELRANSINVVTDVVDNIDIVLVGFDTELTFEKIRKTCEVLKNDLPYIATNPDFACPVKFGFVPDCGAICDMLYHAIGKKPIFIGKPNPFMVNHVMDKFDYSKDEVVVIGDRLYTDIATGINAGVTSVCVLTGEATIEDIIDGEIKPTYTFNNIGDIFECIKN